MINKVFMAFGKAVESVEGSVIKRYIGAAPSFVKAVNPSKEERNKLLNADIEKDVEYIKTKEVDGKTINQVIVTFYVKPDVDQDIIIPMTFFVDKSYRYNKDKTKVQVIDKYGYSSWATQEEVKNHSQLMSSSGKRRRITTEYRPAFNGEIQLIEFIKYYLNIEEAISYINGEWCNNPKVSNIEFCECSLNMEKLFAGDFSEIKEIPNLMPTNKVKIMYGVRTTDEGKQYQAVYTNKVIRNKAKNYSEIEKDLIDRKNYGAFSNVEFDTKPFREYTVEATVFNNNEQSKVEDPFTVMESQAANEATDDSPFGLPF